MMTFSYLTPWLFFVMAVEQLYRRDDLRKDWERLLRGVIPCWPAW